MKSHLSGVPGEYVWDPNFLMFVGRIKSDMTEDHRFTADGRSSFLNGVCKGFNLSNPQRTAKLLTEAEYNGYILKGFSLVVDGSRLTPEMWLAKAGEELQCEGIYEILEQLSQHQGKERQVKQDNLKRLFKREINKRGMQNDPAYKAALIREQAIPAEKLWDPKSYDALFKPIEQKKIESKKFEPELTEDEAWKVLIFCIHCTFVVRYGTEPGYKRDFKRFKKNVFSAFSKPIAFDSDEFIGWALFSHCGFQSPFNARAEGAYHVRKMITRIWRKRYGKTDEKETTRIVVNELLVEDHYSHRDLWELPKDIKAKTYKRIKSFRELQQENHELQRKLRKERTPIRYTRWEAPE